MTLLALVGSIQGFLKWIREDAVFNDDDQQEAAQAWSEKLDGDIEDYIAKENEDGNDQGSV